MIFRQVFFVAEIVRNKPLFLYKNESTLGYARLQLHRSFHNSQRSARRNARRPSFEPLEILQIESGPLHIKSLVKPLCFTLGVSSASIIACVIWEYENLRKHASNLMKKPNSWLNIQQKKMMSHFAQKSEPGPIKRWWNSLRPSEKVFYPIFGANLLVFGAWRIKALQPFMVKYFCSNPSSSTKCLPMILSTFSHYSFLHLAANMYVLYSFMPAAVATLGKEQFVAMYLSGGVISSLASCLYKVIVNQPGLSLGASGAIMSVLSYVCIQYPDTKLSIIFLPMFTFGAGAAIKVIMSIDLAGVILGWKFFDHAAHLGGALFGISWCYWGSEHIWGNRDKFLQYYHVFRKSDSR